jgi:hypothetical protein
MAHRRSLRSGRDDKKGKLVERERTVAKGRGGWDVDYWPSLTTAALLCELKKSLGMTKETFFLGTVDFFLPCSTFQ